MRALIITLTIFSLLLRVSAVGPPDLPDLLYFGTERDMNEIHSNGGLLPGDILDGRSKYLYHMFHDEPHLLKYSTYLANKDGYIYTVFTGKSTSSFKPLDDDGKEWEVTEKVPFQKIVGREVFRKGHLPVYYDIYEWEWEGK
ncbi:hypothetical protein PspLS_10491 [Pyricularia sp. CBS 133598]|nr:hypothetical protein PspLS_10491 [Pyricularia sp. CBS 133598]